MTLKSSLVIFQALKPLQPRWPQWPQQPQLPQWPQQSHFIKISTDPDGLIIPSAQMTNTGPFLWNVLSKIQYFTEKLIHFVSDAVEASGCQFFENWSMKHKSAILLKPLGTLIQKNYWTFYPSEPFRILRFNMRHPVEYSWMSLSGDSPSLPSLALQCSISIEFSLN